MRRRFLAIPLVALALTLAACGSAGNGGYGGTTSGGTSTSTSTSAGTVIGTATAMVNGKSTTLLVSSNGRTLYYFTPDTITASNCTGTCATIWPALLSTGGSPTSSASLSGTLSVINDAHGLQVTYNGHPLYIYSGDSAAGQTNGEGIQGKWFVATPSLATNSNTSGSGGPGY